MQRHPCTHCRTPIRSTSLARRGVDPGSWFHPDCWVEACHSEQERYEQQVQTVGLPALIAPYVSAASARRLLTSTALHA